MTITSFNENSIYTYIEGNPAYGFGPTIPIAIGNISKIARLTREHFGKIFGIINKITLTNNYPSGTDRANHNGTHSARQARLLEIVFSEFASAFKTLTLEEKNHLILAAYLLRSGRIDESSHTASPSDDYCARSAMIYEAYASQLKVSPETISWVKLIISDSCKPKYIRDPKIDQNPKYKLGWDCLTLVHNLDLIRCFSRHDIDTRIKPKIYEIIFMYSENPSNTAEKLLQISKDLCKATGCGRTYDGDPGNFDLFSQCSKDGEKCWNTVKHVKPKAEKGLIQVIQEILLSVLNGA